MRTFCRSWHRINEYNNNRYLYTHISISTADAACATMVLFSLSPPNCIKFQQNAIISCLNTQSSMPIQYNYRQNQKLKRISHLFLGIWWAGGIPFDPNPIWSEWNSFFLTTWLFMWHDVRRIIYSSHFQIGWCVILFRCCCLLSLSVCLSAQTVDTFYMHFFPRKSENMSEFM